MSMIMAAMAGQKGEPPVFNPMTSMGWYAAYWAGDTNWTNPGNGNPVATWTDGSGNTRDLTQPISGDRPVFRASVATLNSKPSVEFNSQFIQSMPGVFGILSQPDTIVVVAQWLSVDGTTDSISSSAGSGQQIVRKRLSGYSIAATSDVNGGTVDTNPHFWVAYFNGGSSSLLIDNSVVATGNAGSQALNGLTLSGGNTGVASTHNIYISFFAVASGDITAHPRWGDFKTWVAVEYGITT